MKFKVDEAARHGEKIREMLKDSTRRCRKGLPKPAKKAGKSTVRTSRWLQRTRKSRSGIVHQFNQQVFV